VHVLCREEEKGEAVKRDIKRETGMDAFVHHLDLASLESVRKCSSSLRNKLEKIDILINNAGVMATPEWRTREGFELQFGTNHVGHFLLTNELLPLLRKAENARVVVVSSSAHGMGKLDFEDLNWRSRPYNSMGAYGQSKLANILFAKELAIRETFMGSGVTTYSLHPGIVKTELSRHFRETFGSVFFYLAKILAPLTKTVESGAQTSICCAVDEALENQTGKYYKDCQAAENSPDADNMEDAERLWEVTMAMVNKQ
jgi:retinol dehydrogenase-12